MANHEEAMAELDGKTAEWARDRGFSLLGRDGLTYRFRAPDGYEWQVVATPDRALVALLDREANRLSGAVAPPVTNRTIRLGPDVVVDPAELASAHWTGDRTPGINYRLRGQDGASFARATREEWDRAMEELQSVPFMPVASYTNYQAALTDHWDKIRELAGELLPASPSQAVADRTAERRTVVLEGGPYAGSTPQVYADTPALDATDRTAYRPTGRVDGEGREVWSCEPQLEPEPEPPQSWRDRKPLL